MVTRRRLAMVMAVLLILTGAVQAHGFGLGANKFKQEVAKEKDAVQLVREVASGGYGLVTTAELKALLDKKADLLLIDTMPHEDSYKKAHIPGARQFLFPIPEMKVWDTAETAGKSEADFLDLLGPDKGRKIVFYCGFVKCTRSHNGALWAIKNGYTNVFRHPGGIFAWKGAGYEAAAVK